MLFLCMCAILKEKNIKEVQMLSLNVNRVGLDGLFMEIYVIGLTLDTFYYLKDDLFSPVSPSFYRILLRYLSNILVLKY